jgi:uncharacterized protein (UPF0333 family)
MKKVILVVIAIMLIVAVSGCSSSSTLNTTTQPISTSINIGDNVILDEGKDAEGEVGNVFVAVTEYDFIEFVKEAYAKDTVGIAKMVLNGQMLSVKGGTKALVIDTNTVGTVNGDLEVYKVRIMSGDYFGESGWVLTTFCKKP